MNALEAFISGCLQGITEFLPVSSSGHLVILHSLFGVTKPRIDFDVLLHIATIFSVVIFFRKEIKEIFSTQKAIGLSIIIGSIPTAFIGLAFKEKFEALFAKPKMVGFMFFITAFVLLAAALKERFSIFKNRLKEETTGPSIGKAFLIGISQGVAIVPGISRSGMTISSGILLGVNAKNAIRFSFLLSIPAVLGASLLKSREITMLGSMHFTNSLIGFLSAFFFGIISLKILENMILKGRLHLFVVYCISMGLFAVLRF